MTLSGGVGIECGPIIYVARFVPMNGVDVIVGKLTNAVLYEIVERYNRIISRVCRLQVMNYDGLAFLILKYFV